jgi:hypothetical protein
MRRFLTLVCLLCLAIPAGMSISGCTRNPAANYCFGLGYGLKVTDVYAISLPPQTGGLSMAFGQTRQIGSPTASTCTGSSAAVPSFSYGTTNNQLVDISPGGSMCAGTWNRNSGGGIANYTICSAPNPLPATNGLPYSSAYVTASGAGVTSNPVQVFVHAPVTALSLVGPTKCLSQGATWPTSLDVQAYYDNNGTQMLLCAPNSSAVQDCSNVIGALSYTVGNTSVASINSVTNQITADLPGTTLITASVAGSSSSAGYFSTCPPASISVALANGQTSGQITPGVTENLVTSVVDTQGNPITGLTLDYQSTDPVDITAGYQGTVSTSYPGVATIYAICQPPACNSAPVNVLGQFGTGLPISSNSVEIATPGTASQFVWFGAPGQSQYFVPVELLTGTVGSSVRLPYVPNSMMMDKLGANLYFGSSHELMVYTASTNTVSKQDGSVPGVVLAVAPDNSTVLINDQVRQVFYIYSPGSGIIATFGGLGAVAAWTPDIKTLYVADSAALNYLPANVAAGTTNHSDTLYVYNQNTGWNSYPLPGAAAAVATCKAGNSTSCSRSLAITVPGVGAYVSGASTVSHTWCPTGTAGGVKADGTVVNSNITALYPQADSVTVATDVLAATTDGKHILGAALSASGVSLSDISVSIPTTVCPGVGVGAGNFAPAVGGALSALKTNGTLAANVPVSNVSASNLNQMVVSPSSSLAFLTYSGATAGAPLPYYQPAASGAGMLNYLSLTDSTPATITAPLAGAFSPDNTLFFVSTSGDNKIHYIDITGTTPKDKQQISPNLPACVPVAAGGNDLGCTYTGSGTVVPATVITVRPRSTT